MTVIRRSQSGLILCAGAWGQIDPATDGVISSYRIGGAGTGTGNFSKNTSGLARLKNPLFSIASSSLAATLNHAIWVSASACVCVSSRLGD